MNGTPIMIRDVEVVTIDPATKVFKVVVHVNAAPMQMHTTEMQLHIAKRVRAAVKYLVDEGFLPPETDQWKCTITGMCHTG